ncbi:hypothetical protein ABEY43_06250 [Priestia megaterium]
MKEFFKRLGYCIGMVAVFIGVVVGAIYLTIALTNHPIIGIILKWVIGVPFGMLLLIAIGVFINWLFIEPFRKNKKK